jgi:hypothetical protein
VPAGAFEITGQQLDVFKCEHTLKGGALKPKPKQLSVGKGKGAAVFEEPLAAPTQPQADVALRTLDIFAGAPCTHLS